MEPKVVFYSIGNAYLKKKITIILKLPSILKTLSIQFSSVSQSCPTLCNPMNCSTSGLPVHHQLPESTQTHIHWFSDAIQPSHPLSSPSPPAPNLSQHQGLFQWVSCSHQMAKVKELALQHKSSQRVFRVDSIKSLKIVHIKKKKNLWDFPHGPVAKTPCFPYRRPRFDPWSGN